MSEKHSNGIDQQGPMPNSSQANTGKNVPGLELSGKFDGPVAAGSGDAVDLRGAQGPIYKPSGPVFVDSVIQFMDEKVFKRLGLEQRVGFVLVAVVVLGTGLGLYFALRPHQPKQMTGDFRVAVAGFTKPKGTQSESGTELAGNVYMRLVGAIKEMEVDFAITVWGPDRVGRIRGQDRAGRARSAEHIARKIGADIVVYGVLDTSTVPWEVMPEFYISESSFYDEAQEIVGQHDLGTAIKLAGQNTVADRIQAGGELDARIRALALLTVGISYDLLGLFEKAMFYFELAESVEGWEEEEGKQVLYLLAGNVALQTLELETAATYYTKSLTLDPEYGRAYVGLGSVYYLRALGPSQETQDLKDIDPDLIDEAIVTYQHALTISQQPSYLNIEAKVDFGLGQCYVAQVYAGYTETFNPAIGAFEAVVDAYAEGANVQIWQLAAESHARLGLIYADSGHPSLAIEHYKQAASLYDEVLDERFRTDMQERRAHYLERAQVLARGNE